MSKPAFTDEFKQGVAQYVRMNLKLLLLNSLVLQTALFISGIKMLKIITVQLFQEGVVIMPVMKLRK